MVPSLYLQLAEATSLEGFAPPNLDVASAYAAVLTTTTITAMAAPIPFGYWAEKRGEREVYVGVTLAATVAALILAVGPNISFCGLGLPTFAAAWGCLSAPLSLRGVRAAFLPGRLSRVIYHARANWPPPRVLLVLSPGRSSPLYAAMPSLLPPYLRPPRTRLRRSRSSRTYPRTPKPRGRRRRGQRRVQQKEEDGLRSTRMRPPSPPLLRTTTTPLVKAPPPLHPPSNASYVNAVPAS